MDRERELKIIRRAYAKQVTAAAGVGDPQVESAFAAVAREDFLGPGPWHIVRWGRRLSCDAGCRPDLPVHRRRDRHPAEA
jgi:protein-L-isoaspartate(D-aspartate) O-methyltransferase